MDIDGANVSGHYDERLSVPLRWWVQSAMLVASLWLAMVVALPGLLAWVITLALLAAVVAALISFGSARVSVRDGELHVGRAHVEARFIGVVDALDAEATRRVAGRDADARAFLMLRPFLDRAVRVRLSDPADPTPYWLVATRHPDRLAQVLTSLAASTAPDLP